MAISEICCQLIESSSLGKHIYIDAIKVLNRDIETDEPQCGGHPHEMNLLNFHSQEKLRHIQNTICQL
jgi:hypothetical protein